MSNTYTQIHIQTIFAVKNRSGLIGDDWKQDLYKYVSGIIHGMSDHVHIFFGMRPSQSLSDLVQEVKSHSSKWINEKKLSKGKFEWQTGFGAFSYSKSQVPDVVAYINDQEIHHMKKTFLEEYKEFLIKFEIDFKEQYIFKELFW